MVFKQNQLLFMEEANTQIYGCKYALFWCCTIILLKALCHKVSYKVFKILVSDLGLHCLLRSVCLNT